MDNGSDKRNKEKELSIIKTAPSMKDIGRTTSRTNTEGYSTPKGMSMKGSGKTESFPE